MFLLGIAVLVLLLKFFEVGPFAQWDWWWVAGIFGLSFLWFEFGERIFGIDKKRRAQDGLDKARKERIEAVMGDPRDPRRKKR
jgi:small Trp-rich protein